MSLAKGVWVIADRPLGCLEDISLQLVCGTGSPINLRNAVHVTVFGSTNVELTERLASYGADKVYYYR